MRASLPLLVFLTAVTGPWPASIAAALQPLETFLEAARKHHPHNHRADALHAQRDAEARATRWRLAPSLQAAGSYTRNQYERSAMFPGDTEPEAFIAIDQLDASITLSVPLVHVGAWEQTGAANAQLDAAAAKQSAAVFAVERQVAQAYFQLLSNQAVAESASRSLALAESNAKDVRVRHAGGLATELDLQRVRADVARAQQDVAAAALAATLARRALATLTGITPESTAALPPDDLHPEPPLSHWMQDAEAVPDVRAAVATRTAAERGIDAARAAWYPTLTATAQERYSNATALVGHPAYYSFKFQLAWQLDGVTFHQAHAQEAAAQAARAEAEQSRLEATDDIFEAWHRVTAGIESARAARVQADAAARAAELSRAQYVGGVATQLDVLAARQDAFRAEVARVQADAQLAFSRTALRLYAGRPLDAQEPSP